MKEVSNDMPIIAQMTISDDGKLLSGATLRDFVAGVAEYKLDAIGINCSVGPKAMLEALEEFRTLTSLPISAQPNTGLPQNIGGRNIYMTSPEYVGRIFEAVHSDGSRDCWRMLRH